MNRLKPKRILEITVLIISIALIVWAAPEMAERLGWEFAQISANDAPTNFIVQGRDLWAVTNNVLREGGMITHTLPIRNAVGAKLNIRQVKALLNSSAVTRIYKSRPEMTIRLARAEISAADSDRTPISVTTDLN